MKGAEQSGSKLLSEGSQSGGFAGVPVQSRAAAGGDPQTGSGIPPVRFQELYRNSGATALDLTLEEFADILVEIGAKYLSTETPRDFLAAYSDRTHLASDEACAFYATLRLEELVLARACAKGVERAWEVFLKRYRDKLYRASSAIAREETAGRELADSLYAELFGMSESDGRPRVSKLNSYSGRGSLEGWLRTVLAQEWVNGFRSQRRIASLDEQMEAGAQFEAMKQESEDAPALDSRLESATDEALRALPAEDRYILASYYLDGYTLGEIARVLRVHESTISRRVEKITKALRKRIVRALGVRGMSREQVEEALNADVRDFSLDVRARLIEQQYAQEKGPGIVP